MNTSPHIANALLLLAVSATYLADARAPRSLGAVRIEFGRRHVRGRNATHLFDMNALARAGALPACAVLPALRASPPR